MPLNRNGASPPGEGDDSEKVNILVVDDLQEKHVVFRTILEELGQNLVSARSGREALRFLLEQEFAVILLDVNMPDLDGFETARMIRQYKRTAQTPILFVTAYVDEIQAIQGYALGAVDYISSPVVPEILRSKVKVFVDLHRMNRRLRNHADEREALAHAEAARVAAEAATQRADFLAEASHKLTRSLDVDATVTGLLKVAVPYLARTALVTLVDEQSRIGRIEFACPSSDGGAIRVSVLGARSRLRAPLLELVRQALTTREAVSLIHYRIWDHLVDGAPGDTPQQADRLALQTAEVFPLFAGDHSLGALTLMSPGPVRMHNNMRALVKEVASRASIAFENAFLFGAIQEADQRKNEFLAMLAHELRNPLAPIRNAVHVMKSVDGADDKVVWARDVIGKQVDHMVRIIDDLLDVSRIARGKVTLKEEVVTLDAIVERAVEASRPHFISREQELALETHAGGAAIDGDLVRLAQVISNLLNNASKFTPQHGRIVLRTETADGQAVISVKDDGEGIDPKFMPRVFDLFAQADSSLDRTQGGLGIGLTLVKRLTEMHNGRVECRSAGRGEGAEFIVRLPLSTRTPAAVVPSAPVVAQSTPGGLRILVVDDIEASAESLGMLLELEGHEVRIASDGMAAVLAAESFVPDIVLLDIGLPEMNGYEVARRLRQREELKETMIVALTGYGQPEDRRLAKEAGCNHHLVKPADIPGLLRLVDQHGATRQCASPLAPLPE